MPDTNLHDNDTYYVVTVDDAMDENGTDRCVGYGIFNKNTGVRECTTLVLPDAIFRADHFNRMLAEISERAEAQVEEIPEGVPEDVVPH